MVPLGSELIGNPGFEVDTSGWTVEGSANELSHLDTGGHSGDGAVEVCTDTGGTFGISDSPNWVSYTEDRAYTASIWVRSDTSVATLTLRLREYLGGVQQGISVTETVALTPSWQQVTVNYTPVAPGSSLDFEAYIKTHPPASASKPTTHPSRPLPISPIGFCHQFCQNRNTLCLE